MRWKASLPVRLRAAGFMLPTGLTGYLWLKGLHPDLPGLNCPLRSLTGIPCPGCFLTRATSAALIGDLPGSVEMHAFGPAAAALLVWWSITAIRKRRLVPRRLTSLPFGLAGVSLTAYWLIRLGLSYGLGIQSFPAFPSLNT